MLEEKKVTPAKPPVKTKPHYLDMENRERLNLTGIEDVESFDEDCIVANTVMGAVSIKGSNLHINKLNIDTNELCVEGKIQSIVYSDSHSGQKGGLFAKMFK